MRSWLAALHCMRLLYPALLPSCAVASRLLSRSPVIVYAVACRKQLCCSASAIWRSALYTCVLTEAGITIRISGAATSRSMYHEKLASRPPLHAVVRPRPIYCFPFDLLYHATAFGVSFALHIVMTASRLYSAALPIRCPDFYHCRPRRSNDPHQWARRRALIKACEAGSPRSIACAC
jgi:hypothetical protein